MLSIFVIYSKDRKPQLEQMIECMRDMNHYDSCQKTLVVDGDYGEETNVKPEGWGIDYVKRYDGVFSWSKMWVQGVANSRNDVVLYLDSDRILPRNYIDLIIENIDDDKFLFNEEMFTFLRDVDTKIVKTYRDNFTADALRIDYDIMKDLLWYDPRYKLPCHGPGKGVMSGNTAFTKKTFEKSGGVDPWYVGHGAYADSDYHKQCWEMGMDMVNLGALELHLHHEKLTAESDHLSRADLEILSLNNYIRYCRKWRLDLDRARYIANCLKLSDDFVKRVTRKVDSELSDPKPGFYDPIMR